MIGIHVKVEERSGMEAALDRLECLGAATLADVGYGEQHEPKAKLAREAP